MCPWFEPRSRSQEFKPCSDVGLFLFVLKGFICAFCHLISLNFYRILTPMMTTPKQPNNPLHGITLESIVSTLVNHYGWNDLAERIPVNCFINDPSIKSSLKFLRKTQWARVKVERLYLSMLNTKSKH